MAFSQWGTGQIKPLGQTSVEVVVKKQKYVLYCEVVDDVDDVVVDGNVPNLLAAIDSERLVKGVYHANKFSGCVVKQSCGILQDNNANVCPNTASTDTSNECTEIRDRPLLMTDFSEESQF